MKRFLYLSFSPASATVSAAALAFVTMGLLVQMTAHADPGKSSRLYDVNATLANGSGDLVFFFVNYNSLKGSAISTSISGTVGQQSFWCYGDLDPAIAEFSMDPKAKSATFEVNLASMFYCSRPMSVVISVSCQEDGQVSESTQGSATVVQWGTSWKYRNSQERNSAVCTGTVGQVLLDQPWGAYLTASHNVSIE